MSWHQWARWISWLISCEHTRRSACWVLYFYMTTILFSVHSSFFSDQSVSLTCCCVLTCMDNKASFDPKVKDHQTLFPFFFLLSQIFRMTIIWQSLSLASTPLVSGHPVFLYCCAVITPSFVSLLPADELVISRRSLYVTSLEHEREAAAAPRSAAFSSTVLSSLVSSLYRPRGVYLRTLTLTLPSIPLCSTPSWAHPFVFRSVHCPCWKEEKGLCDSHIQLRAGS